MDWKNSSIGILLICAAFFMIFKSQEQAKEAIASAKYVQEIKKEAKAEAAAQATAQVATPATSAQEEKASVAEEFFTLKNDFIEVQISNFGAAIKQVSLLNYPQTQESDEPFIFNDNTKTYALALALNKDEKNPLPTELRTPFTLTEKGQNVYVFKAKIHNEYEIERKFWLEAQDNKKYSPYIVYTSTTVKNISGQEIPASEFYLALGMASPTEGDIYGTNLSVGIFDGTSEKFLRSSPFISSKGFMGIGASDAKSYEVSDKNPVVWASVKNQFFAAIYTPIRSTGIRTISFPVALDLGNENKYMQKGIAGYVAFNSDSIAANDIFEISGSYYVGPKDIYALMDMGKRQELIMHFGPFGFLSKPMLIFLNFIQSIIAKVSPEWSWGWAIIVLTLVVRAIMWPLTAKQIKSSKRMSALAGPLKALKEKYKGDQQKVSQETMKLYGEYGINPLAGCFPVLIQLPVFLGLYFMIQTVSEIRFAHFLWIQDLSLPDTIPGFPTIFGFPLHLLPLINAFLSYIQMQITPMPSAEKAHKIMFRLMPFLMLIFFYTFPSGLILYWTVQSFLGIVQAWVVVRSKEDISTMQKIERKGPGFMQRLQAAAEQAQARKNAQKSGGETRKSNPGGRSTKSKRS